MESHLQAVVIGIIQGLTEFLPISSSAHLIVVPQLLGWNDPFLNSNEFDVMLHLGTLAALLVYFGRDLAGLARAFGYSVRQRRIGGDPQRRLAWLLLLTVIPAALLGVALEEFFDTFFRDELGVDGVLLLVGAGLLALAERFGSRARDLDRLRARDALAIGLAQAFALFPGISRSGITIAAGLFVGLDRPAAARFAFLMGTPIIAGAGLWKLRSLLSGEVGPFDPTVLFVGMAAAAISGLLAIGFLLAYLQRRSTALFIGYRVVFALLVFAMVLTR